MPPPIPLQLADVAGLVRSSSTQKGLGRLRTDCSASNDILQAVCSGILGSLQWYAALQRSGQTPFSGLTDFIASSVLLPAWPERQAGQLHSGSLFQDASGPPPPQPTTTTYPVHQPLRCEQLPTLLSLPKNLWEGPFSKY